jgi:hypothetical protein
MAHSPESVTQYVCANCQVTHAGIPIHEGPGDHNFDPPEVCGACSESTFIDMQDWIRHHD